MSARDLLDLIWIVPALPLLGAVVLLLFGKRIGEPAAGWIATSLVVLARRSHQAPDRSNEASDR